MKSEQGTVQDDLSKKKEELEHLKDCKDAKLFQLV